MKILLLLLGLLVRYIIGRRRFNRRSLAGVQGFKSYTRAILITTVEKVINGLALLCIILSVMLFIIS
jgi:hypothetical protein